MDKAKKKASGGSGPATRKGKAKTEKPKTPSLIRYEELLKEMEALNLPPTDIVGDEKRLRALEGY